MENFFAKSALLFIIAQHKYSFQVVPRNMETCKIQTITQYQCTTPLLPPMPSNWPLASPSELFSLISPPELKTY